MTGRSPSPRARLLRAGFTDVERALTLLAEPSLLTMLSADQSGQVVPADRGTAPLSTTDDVRNALVSKLASAADPDLALLALIRLTQAVNLPTTRADLPLLLRHILNDNAQACTRLISVLGVSQALGDFLIAHPEQLDAVCGEARFDSAETRSFLASVVERALKPLTENESTTDSEISDSHRQAVVREAADALRCAYRNRLTAIVATDLMSTNPMEHMPTVGRQMADLVDASIDCALQIARAAVGSRSDGVSLAVIAMGKTGGRELNYISDVDVIHVVGPAPGTSTDEETVIAVGTELATQLSHVTSGPEGEPPLWPLDTALRPEGKDGALVRTLDSHIAYYQCWAHSWEFQALLKARCCAGDRELGKRYIAAVTPFVWQASQRENFVEDARAMRRRVERESARGGETDRRIKLGPGGLRDVEFTIQLLQLVHGRSDESLRCRGTLPALQALSAGGYVGREDAAELARCYKFLRLLEHRCQVYKLRRTHELPTRTDELHRIGRGIDRKKYADPEQLESEFQKVRRRVRTLHEEIYYRPLLNAAASLSTEEMSLSAQAAKERLAAVGYLDPEGALRHIQSLTGGVSRRAAIQRQLLPVIIGWIGEGPDPDAGLLSFRRLSEAIGGSHWYLAMLRDSPVAAKRFTKVLSGARWTTEQLAEIPAAVAWLDEDKDLKPRSRESLTDEMRAILRRRQLASGTSNPAAPAQAAVRALLNMRRREYLRAALGASLDSVTLDRSASILTPATDITLEGALLVAQSLARAEHELAKPSAGTHKAEQPSALARHAIIAMGRLGGAEISYASDADVLFVHEALPGVEEDAAAEEAESVARWTIRLLGAAELSQPLLVDTDLRPEGRQGKISRSLKAYAEYYERWSVIWERQALLRARFCAGDAELGQQFEKLIAPLRWNSNGITQKDQREIRRIKARMEAERMPRGVTPFRHLKLGPGGLSDIEWTAQILQLQHAGNVSGLRTTSTLTALRAAQDANLLSAEDTKILCDAWTFASRIRSAIVLATGRTTGARLDILPESAREVRSVARLLGYRAGHERDLEDQYRKTARHARAVVERVFFAPSVSTLKPTEGNPASVLAAAKPTILPAPSGERITQQQRKTASTVKKTRQKPVAARRNRRNSASPFPWEH